MPSARTFTGRTSPDEPFLFKTKSPANQLVGGGYFEGYHELRVSEAWAIFGEGNGCADEEALERSIQTYRDRTRKPRMPDPTIGCITLRNLFFAPSGGELPQPEQWGRSIVQGRTYDVAEDGYAYVATAFRILRSGVRLDPVWDRDLALPEAERDRYGDPVLTRHRLGQGAFRLQVLDAYDNRCAITGNRLAPALEAAHIRSYARGGRHVVPNGMALRSDLHRLFDRGYIGIDPDYRIRVSPRVRRDSGNGIELYEREERGETILLPARAAHHPDREALTWHREQVFRAA